MRQCEATEGDICLRRGARIKKNTRLAFMLKSRARRLTVLECEWGGRGLFIYTADEYTHAHIDSDIFSLISQ